MAATCNFLFSFFFFSHSNNPFSPPCCHIHQQQQHQESVLSPFLLFFFTFSFCSLTILIFSLYSKLTKKKINNNHQHVIKVQQDLSNDEQLVEEIKQHQSDPNPTHLTHSILLEILPSNSPEWAKLFANDPNKIESGLDEETVKEKVKKKKRVKKKRPDSNSEEEGKKDCGVVKEKEELVCLYPFTKSSSATQRKIKQHYDELVKSHESNGLTLAQVGQFVNCLVEARNELQHKSEVIQRRFTITKALLFKADRSSFVRLRQQIYKLELEQKRLEEDAFVYNWLQQQLKLSPAYKKMLEIGADMEIKAKSSELVENTDPELPDISFEELLAQEKKDAFWQRNGRRKIYSG
ncbi:uncharacterized protein LOC132633463 [Lycium barbarum]|uniref:uncharacterized protein LOC132633463 n=1 Tax=Lycium barbarum TaxID=112863 RepID=UPI00293F5698|nr:uncharacterized protein LOC132633463 [Lycium barbarum]XP_060205880.1 uncharacterized protein LOC132633463 [Lycium barbarum]